MAYHTSTFAASLMATVIIVLVVGVGHLRTSLGAPICGDTPAKDQTGFADYVRVLLNDLVNETTSVLPDKFTYDSMIPGIGGPGSVSGTGTCYDQGDKTAADCGNCLSDLRPYLDDCTKNSSTAGAFYQGRLPDSQKADHSERSSKLAVVCNCDFQSLAHCNCEPLPEQQQHQSAIVVDAPAAVNGNADTSAAAGGESEPSPLPFGAKRPLKSDVWPHFTRFVDKDGVMKARCKYCRKVLGGDTSNGTSHLRNHTKVSLCSCPPPHTSEKLASVLREALMSWNVDYAGKADIQGLETCFSAMTMEDPSCEEFKKEDFQGSQSRTLLDIED
ncbi:unnamed protein product [Linum tenue]|uniref:BED-type domain-containing protein n=1 Tax=Linum tenue TaxID=586396 RepID=A0AAV0N7Z3_9ROSI|nr:unnamed protein product [Linum tenue]